MFSKTAKPTDMHVLVNCMGTTLTLVILFFWPVLTIVAIYLFI